MSHIESRPSKRSKSEYDFIVDCEELQGARLQKFMDALKGQALSITLHSEEDGGGTCVPEIPDFFCFSYRHATKLYNEPSTQATRTSMILIFDF